MNLYFMKVKSKNKVISKKEYLDNEMLLVKKAINKEGFYHDKNGKPLLINNPLHISITNNNKIIVIATNKKEIGIDLQVIKKNSKFSLEKIKLISIKEALFKCENISFNIIDKLNINVNKKNLIRINNDKYILFSKKLDNYVFSICYKI